MTLNKIWVNGRLKDKNDAVISVFDRGFLYGDGLFETARAYAGIVFSLDGHLSRLYGSAKKLKINIPYPRNNLKAAVYRTLKANALRSAYVRITVTRGEGEPGINFSSAMMPNVVIMVREFEGYPAALYRKGIKAKFASTKQSSFSMLARVKSTSFLNYIMARQEARQAGFGEAILTDCGGYIAEAATGNIFAVKNGKLLTPPLTNPILAGITRGIILKIAKKLKIAAAEKRITVGQLLGSDEIFLTNSLAEVLPIVVIGRNRIGNGVPGPVTKLLHISYQKEVIRSVLSVPK
jgi:branched-chain amino acid aminotransferase